MFSVPDWLNEIVDSCTHRRGCKADIITPCDDLEKAEEEQRRIIAEEESA